MKLLLLATTLFGLVPAATIAQIGPVTRRPADLRKYVGKASSLSFMAAGVGALDDCQQPLEFREAQKGTLQILEIICRAGDEPRFARLTFVRYTSATGRLQLSPFRIEFLP